MLSREKVQMARHTLCQNTVQAPLCNTAHTMSNMPRFCVLRRLGLTTYDLYPQGYVVTSGCLVDVLLLTTLLVERKSLTLSDNTFLIPPAVRFCWYQPALTLLWFVAGHNFTDQN